MKNRRKLALWFLTLAVWSMFAVPVLAQEPPTPTPNAAGEIIVTVQLGDTLWSIAARSGLSLDALLALNGLTETAVLVPGQLLVIGRITLTPTPTSTPPPTPTLPRPPLTQTPLPRPRTAVCLLAFTDLNGNGRQDDGEPLQSGVAFTIYNETAVVDNYVTNRITEPHCLESLQPGDYHITRSVAADETLTTEGNWTITLLAGEVVQVDFGSYSANDPVILPTGTAVPTKTAGESAPVAGSPARPFPTWVILLAGLIGIGVIFLAGLRRKK